MDLRGIDLFISENSVLADRSMISYRPAVIRIHEKNRIDADFRALCIPLEAPTLSAVDSIINIMDTRSPSDLIVHKVYVR